MLRNVQLKSTELVLTKKVSLINSSCAMVSSGIAWNMTRSGVASP